MTKRRNRWSQEEGDALIEEVDNRVFKAGGSLTVHRLVVVCGIKEEEASSYKRFPYNNFITASFTARASPTATT